MDSTERNLSPNPYESANCLSKLFFVWILPFLRKSYRTILKLEDIYQPISCDKSEILGDRLEANWVKLSTAPKRPLLSALYLTFWKDYALLSTLSFFNDIICRLGQPFLLSYLLQYFRTDTNMPYHDALLYASGIVLLNAFSAIFKSHIQYISFHNGMKIRAAVCSLIYRKALRLSQTALHETSPGQIVNLVTNDVSRFHLASFLVDTIWIAPLLTIFTCGLMWVIAGMAGMAGILVVFAMVPILSCAGKFTSKYRLKTAQRTDERVRLIHEVITSIEAIKMFAWEKPFSKLISRAREIELKCVRKVLCIRSFHMTTSLFTTRMALFCSMLAIIFLYGPEQLTARIFIISTYLSIVSNLMSIRFGRAVAEIAEVNVSLQRLEKFLRLEENQTKCIPCQQQNELDKMNRIEDGFVEIKIQEPDSDVAILMKHFTARWKLPKNQYVQSSEKHNRTDVDVDHDPFYIIERETLSNLSVHFPKGKLTAIIGPVGAGKSSLLQAILGELPLETGSLSIHGSISYASQEPFVFSASVRQNILFGEEYDRKQYNAVVHTCALEKDFEQFKKGDQTIVGERGTSLSGGQKARINLARACYRDADIFLFDDPLSAVDNHVGEHIFEKCIGPKSRLAERGATRILVTHQLHFLKEADWIIVLKDGKIDVQGTVADLCMADNEFTNSVEIEKIPVEFRRRGSDTPSIKSQSSDVSWSERKTDTNQNVDDVQMKANSKNAIKGWVLLHYFRAGANWSLALILLFLFLFVQFLASFSDYFVSIWIELEEKRKEGSRGFMHLSTLHCMSIQGALIIAILVLGFIRAIGFFSLCLRISRNIHRSMFKGIISTKMRFFDTTPSSRVLHKFAKNIGTIDGFLPNSLFDSMQNTLNLIGSSLVIAAVNPIFLIPVLILSTIFITFQRIFLKITRNVKRLESTTRTPILTHFAATINGLSSVRAYKVEEMLKKQFDSRQDAYSACWLTYATTLSAFSFFIDILCLIFISCVIFYYMLFDTGASGEHIGLAISQGIKITGLVALSIHQSTAVSRQTMMIERLLEYGSLEREKRPEKPIVLDDNWPLKGSIAFHDVFYRYSAEAEPVLRGLSFAIKPKEKIGIVGRTGAGKSSLIGALFRLANVDGEISIDGIDTANIKLKELRRRITIIPQDPVLYSGTLRKNLDPFEEYSDAEIWNALDCVEMKELALDSLGLESRVLPRGSNYSQGTRQLLCLARAILRKNRILVLDEATANVDPKTDALIQRTIRQKLTECTVLTIAHRLDTVIDSDRIMVIDSGQIIEFDEPHNLLQDERGAFHGMIKSLGENEFGRLWKIAVEKEQRQS